VLGTEYTARNRVLLTGTPLQVRRHRMGGILPPALLPRCASTAPALLWRCSRTALALLPHCSGAVLAHV
jgi:hypothetical protein